MRCLQKLFYLIRPEEVNGYGFSVLRKFDGFVTTATKSHKYVIDVPDNQVYICFIQ